MKLKDGFLLRRVAGENVVLPIGGDLDQNMMITLNGTGAFLWERLGTETDVDTLIGAIMEHYGTDEALAHTAVEGFLAQLRERDFLE